MIMMNFNMESNCKINTTLTCHYTGVTDPSKLEVNWEFRPKSSKNRTVFWTYYGRNGIDTFHVNGNKNKFKRLETNIMEEHAIQLNEAAEKDAGLYTCKVECQCGSNMYSTDVDSEELVIVGKAMCN